METLFEMILKLDITKLAGGGSSASKAYSLKRLIWAETEWLTAERHQ
jgi:hypothetical protein